MNEIEPIKTWQDVLKLPVRRDLPYMPDVDNLLDRQANDEILGRDYNPGDDPEDLDNYFEPYQND